MTLPEISWEFTVVLIHHHTHNEAIWKVQPKDANIQKCGHFNNMPMEYAGRETSSHGDLLRYQSHVMADQVQVGGTQRTWSWPTFSSFSTSFWSSLSCSVGGWQKLSSSWKQVEVAICVLLLFNWFIWNSNKYQTQNQYQINYQTKILRKQLTVVSPVDDTGDLNLLGEVTIWIHWHHHHHYHHHNCQYHCKSDPHTRPHSLNDRLTDSATQLS